MKKRLFTLVSLILVVVMTIMSVTACGSLDFHSTSETPEIDNPQVDDSGDGNHEDQHGPDISPMTYSWENDLDLTQEFVYGLIASELETEYDVFSAYLTLKNGENIYGLGFTNYESAYTIDGTNENYFSSGFLALADEREIPEDELLGGMEIHPLDSTIDSEVRFVYSSRMEDVESHCVVFDKYIQYGTRNGVIQFTETDYKRGECNEALGALYSYDESRYLIDPEVGAYTPLTGSSISACIDFAAIEDEINKIIREQNVNFSQTDVETAVFIAQEALESYLLSLQEETFMGYNVEELLSYSEELDPMESLRFTEDGIIFIDIEPTPPPQPSAFMKWMTGIVCGIAIVGSMALSVFVPALAPVSGAIIGSAVEVFSEVIVQNNTIENVDWRKVGIAALSGAISANTGIFGDAIIGGITNSVFAIMDGGGIEAALQSFTLGVGAGIVLGAAFKVVTKGIGAIINKAAPKFVNKVGTFISDHQIDIGGKLAKQADDIASPRNNYNAQKAAQNLIDAQTPLSNQIDDLANIGRYSDDVLDGVTGDIPNREKILYGKISGKSFKGGHSPQVANSPDFEWDGSPIKNPDGTTSYRNVTYSIGGKQGGKNFHTVFPDDWSDSKITKAIDFVAKNCPLGSPDSNGNRLFCAYVNGVQVVVIKNSMGIITAGYPSGGTLAENLITQFSIILK